MNLDLKQLAQETVCRADVAVVTTINGEGFPESRAMFNLRLEKQFPNLQAFFQGREAFEIYLTTNTSSRKLSQLRNNPKASIYFSLPEEWRGIDLVGNLTEVTDSSIKQGLWQAGWELYYPGGWEDPDYCVLMMKPQFIRYYHQLQTVEFKP